MYPLDRLPLPSDCEPRFVTGDEEENLMFWFEDHFNTDSSSAGGMLMASHVAVYDHCNRMLDNYLGTVIILNNGGSFYVFSSNKDAVKLEKQFDEVEPDKDLGVPYNRRLP